MVQKRKRGTILPQRRSRRIAGISPTPSANPAPQRTGATSTMSCSGDSASENETGELSKETRTNGPTDCDTSKEMSIDGSADTDNSKEMSSDDSADSDTESDARRKRRRLAKIEIKERQKRAHENMKKEKRKEACRRRENARRTVLASHARILENIKKEKEENARKRAENSIKLKEDLVRKHNLLFGSDA